MKTIVANYLYKRITTHDSHVFIWTIGLLIVHFFGFMGWLTGDPMDFYQTLIVEPGLFYIFNISYIAGLIANIVIILFAFRYNKVQETSNVSTSDSDKRAVVYLMLFGYAGLNLSFPLYVAGHIVSVFFTSIKPGIKKGYKWFVGTIDSIEDNINVYK